MIDSLTEEQKAKMKDYVDEYVNVLLTYVEPDYKEVKSFIDWIYKDISGMKEPEVVIVDSPMAAQKLANKMAGNKEMKYYEFSSYVNIWDMPWIAFYKFFQNEFGIVNNENFDKYCKLKELGIYDTIQFESVCIVVKLPTLIKRRVERLHCEDGPAIAFKDDYKLYFWNGVAVPEKLIMTPEAITSEDILQQSNAEVRRAFREKLGGTTYYNILTNGKGLTILDEDDDEQGFPMKLYETKEADPIVNEKVQFIEVTCPSTLRVYNIYPPNQKCKNVWEAKASTFSDAKGMYRHGDVMLENLLKPVERPIQET